MATFGYARIVQESRQQKINASKSSKLTALIIGTQIPLPVKPTLPNVRSSR